MEWFDMKVLVELFVPLGVCVALPCIIVWLTLRKKTNDTNQRTQIILAAIEKQSDIDVEEFFKKMQPKKTSLKIRMLNKLLWGSICTLIGVGLSVMSFYLMCQDDDFIVLLIPSLICLAIGVGFLINYFVGKKMLSKEFEEEAQ